MSQWENIRKYTSVHIFTLLSHFKQSVWHFNYLQYCLWRPFWNEVGGCSFDQTLESSFYIKEPRKTYEFANIHSFTKFWTIRFDISSIFYILHWWPFWNNDGGHSFYQILGILILYKTTFENIPVRKISCSHHILNSCVSLLSFFQHFLLAAILKWRWRPEFRSNPWYFGFIWKTIQKYSSVQIFTFLPHFEQFWLTFEII